MLELVAYGSFTTMLLLYCGWSALKKLVFKNTKTEWQQLCCRLNFSAEITTNVLTRSWGFSKLEWLLSNDLVLAMFFSSASFTSPSVFIPCSSFLSLTPNNSHIFLNPTIILCKTKSIFYPNSIKPFSMLATNTQNILNFKPFQGLYSCSFGLGLVLALLMFQKSANWTST